MREFCVVVRVCLWVGKGNESDETPWCIHLNGPFRPIHLAWKSHRGRDNLKIAWQVHRWSCAWTLEICSTIGEWLFSALGASMTVKPPIRLRSSWLTLLLSKVASQSPVFEKICRTKSSPYGSMVRFEGMQKRPTPSNFFMRFLSFNHF